MKKIRNEKIKQKKGLKRFLRSLRTKRIQRHYITNVNDHTLLHNKTSKVADVVSGIPDFNIGT